MIEMTMRLPEDLAEEVQPLDKYMPTVLRLALAGFRTLAVETSTEIIEYLSTEPMPEEVLAYHVSDRAQTRLQRLLALNSASLLGESEKLELDELEKIEHILVMLKAQVMSSN